MIKELMLSKITPNPKQPRKHFDELSLLELADSILKDGLQEEILVRPVGDGYEIVQGERRFRACKMAGLQSISAKIRHLNDAEAFHLSVIENIHREQLTLLEEAMAFQEYTKLGFTHEEVAKKVNKSREYVTNRLRMHKLTPSIMKLVEQGILLDGHIKQILKMEEFTNRLCRDMSHTFEGSSFEHFQTKFINENWMKFKKDNGITVLQVKKWADDFRVYLLQLLLAQFSGKGDFIMSEMKGLPISAEYGCFLYNLDIATVSRADIVFLNENDPYFYEDINMWEVFWEQINKDNANWNKPRDPQTLRQELYNNNKSVFDETIFVHKLILEGVSRDTIIN